MFAVRNCCTSVIGAIRSIHQNKTDKRVAESIKKASLIYREAFVKSRHAPFKQILGSGPGYTPGSDNVQHGLADVGVDNSDILVPPNGQWRCTLDPYEWSLWNASDWEQNLFRLSLPHPRRVVLEPNGQLHILDVALNTIWSRGPFPGTSAPYQLRCENEPDLALYDASGRRLWSARQNGV